MPIIAKTSGGDRISILAPPGLQPAVCCDVKDQGMHENKFQPGKKTHKISIHWLIGELIPQTYTHPYTNERSDTGELVGKPMMVSRWFTNSLHEKASLRSFLRAWRGRDFTQEQLAGFDLETLIGVRCALNISHSQAESTGNWYANVDLATLLPKGMTEVDVPADYVRFCDRKQDGEQPVNGDEQPPHTADHGDEPETPF